MRTKIGLTILTILLAAGCVEKDLNVSGEDLSGFGDVGHEMIILGEKLEDPYSVSNVTKALQTLYPETKGRVDVRVSDLYVRFLPKTEAEYDRLLSLGIDLIDHPLDYKIVKDGDYYHDPQIAEDKITWQYAVVKQDFDFPRGIEYEILDECYIPSAATEVKSGGIDWEAVEREAYKLTGNEELWQELTKAETGMPQGRITIVDDKANGGQPFGLAGVRVQCNSFVKFASAYTDRDGYYQINRKYSSNLRYRLVFTNEKQFNIGFNLILRPASASALGKAGPGGLDVQIDSESDRKLFSRAAVNNAVYDYIERCSPEDMDIAAPPKDLRLWIFQKSSSGCSPMLHQGAGNFDVLKDLLQQYYSFAANLLRSFLPDIIVGVKDDLDYADIYASACHELSHSSHYMSVGNEFWGKYMTSALLSFIPAASIVFNSQERYSSYCEVAEMWAYFMENVMYQERYGGLARVSGMNFWFKPHIFTYLHDRGMTKAQLFSALTPDVICRDDVIYSLSDEYPEYSAVIEQVSDRYPSEE